MKNFKNLQNLHITMITRFGRAVGLCALVVEKNIHTSKWHGPYSNARKEHVHII